MNEPARGMVKARVLATLACLALGACGGRTRPTVVAVGPAARAHGYARYETLDADAHHVDAVVSGAWLARVHVDADGEVTTERLEEAGRVTVLHATADALDLTVDGATHALARRRGDFWTTQALNPAARVPLASLLALDVDLAVQGSSIIWRGGAYVQCTLGCARAAACVARDLDAACARLSDDCAGCLEAAP